MEGIFDSHAHYDDRRFDEDRDAVIEQIYNAGVRHVLNVGCDLQSSRRSIALAKKYSFFHAGVGFHPHDAAKATGDAIEQIRTLAKEEKVVCIGEIGLDYHYDFSPREVQKQVFEAQLKLAGELKLPVSIHAREALEDTMKLLQVYRPEGVLHCYTGSAEMARVFVKMGLYIGFTGVVTFKNARKTLEVIEMTPTDRILLETDCPYMAPEPFRGQRCTSDLIEYTAGAVAKVKGVSPQKIVEIAAENAKRLFRLA